ncbi:MAG: preprotein translocase subunit SecY [Desulfobacterales bacterium]
MIGSGFQNVFKIPELKKRIVFTLALLIVYRVGVHVPVPGIDTAALASFFARAEGTIFGIFNMFSGGAFQRLSVFALGIMPYISASIILQLLTVVIPHLEQLKKEGEQGRKKITQYTRYGTVILSIIQGFGISVGLESMSSPGGAPVVMMPGWAFRLMTVAGNTFRLLSTGEMGLFIALILAAFMVLVVGFIIFVEQGQRRIPVQYAKRVIGRKMYGGQSTHLPLKINTSGVIPPIFASSIIMFPATIGSFINIPWIKSIAGTMRPGNVFYELLYVGFIFFFCYFYTAVTFNPVDVADNMKKQGGYIPGIRPGKRTADYIDKVLTRITLGGAIYVSAVCVLPSILITRFNVPFYFGGTALLIVVGVALDTVAQIESHMLSRHYEGFLKQGTTRVRSR